jgi:uncharacterized protein YkwD
MLAVFLFFGFNHSTDENILQPKTKNSNDLFKTEMLDLVNQIRSEGCFCGKRYMPPAPALKWNSKLEKAAISHAKDMNSNKFIGHRGSDGSKIGDRISEASYSWKAIGENVNWGARSVEDAVLGWKGSTGHCINLMSTSFEEIGAANDGRFWVQNFGRKMEK